MPNVMVALPHIGGALCSMLQTLADAHYLTAVNAYTSEKFLNFCKGGFPHPKTAQNMVL